MTSKDALEIVGGVREIAAQRDIAWADEKRLRGELAEAHKEIGRLEERIRQLEADAKLMRTKIVMGVA